jgi:two-component system, response regulator
MIDGTILLVEDDDDDRLLVLRALRKAGMTNEIRIARDGAEALALFAGEFGPASDTALPTVVLLDLKLPKVDGLEVLRHLRADPHTKLLPIVMLTSSDEQEDILRSYELGVNSYVRKPVDFALFAETVIRLGLYWVLVNRPPAAD